MPETLLQFVACLMFLTVPSLPMNLLPGEDDREARLLEGHPQSGDKLDDLSDTCADSDVPPSQCRAATLPFQLSVNHSLHLSYRRLAS